MLTFVHIPTGTTVNKAIHIDASKSRGVAPAIAPTMIGADRNRRGYTLRSGSGCLTNGVHLTRRRARGDAPISVHSRVSPRGLTDRSKGTTD